MKLLKTMLAVLALSAAGSANAELVPFAVTTSGNVAERLAYGAGSVDINAAARITTDYADVSSKKWYQEVYLNGQDSALSFSIDWVFSGAQTMKDRFSEAARSGVGVSWLVKSGSQQYTIDGTWRFSHSSGLASFNWDNSGTEFSDDDGIWGAGSVVDGNGSVNPIRWGVGNHNGSDGNGAWVNGAGGTYSAQRNIMYINNVSSPAMLGLMGLGLMGLAARRRT
jgi:hypothetical protein